MNKFSKFYDERTAYKKILRSNLDQPFQFTLLIANIIWDYFMLTFVLDISPPVHGSHIIVRFIFFALLLYIIFHFIKKSYHYNKEGDNKDFIARFVCLILPITVRISIKTIPLAFGLLFLFIIVSPILYIKFEIYSIALQIFVVTLIYKKISKVFHKISTFKNSIK